MLVATASFTDPTDGQPIVAGRTHVAKNADVARMFPDRFRPVRSRGAIKSGNAGVGRSRLPSSAKPFGYEYDRVQLRRATTEPTTFVVDLTPSSRKAIEAEIRRVRRRAGNVEVGGFLYATTRPREWSDSVSVCLATWAGEGATASRDSLMLGDPIELQSEFPQEWRHLKRVGDWHTHGPGSTLPSDADAKAWAGNMDGLGIERYIGLIVSPSAEGSGWMIPSFTPWVTRREGYPSRPVCEPARIVI